MFIDWLDELKKNEGSHNFNEEILFIENIVKPIKRFEADFCNKKGRKHED